MGYKDLLTGHGVRATISTALNEIGYPKVWVDSQLSHADPDKISATYNHAEYVEPRRHMMQDWADRLDLLEQGHLKAACAHLTIRIDGMPMVSGGDSGVQFVNSENSIDTLNARSMVIGSYASDGSFQRLSPLPPASEPELVVESAVSDIQRERQEMLDIYESSHVLPVHQFAKLAGKSRDQINREIKAGKLLVLGMGNRGQRIPDWHLDPVKSELIFDLLKQPMSIDSWQLYKALRMPRESLNGCSGIERVSLSNLNEMAQLIVSDLR